MAWDGRNGSPVRKPMGLSKTCLNCHGGSGADDDDSKEAALHGFDQHGRGWIEDSSSNSSSLHENLIRVENEWPVGGSSDSSAERFSRLPIIANGKLPQVTIKVTLILLLRKLLARLIVSQVQVNLLQVVASSSLTRK